VTNWSKGVQCQVFGYGVRRSVCVCVWQRA
jgi:hypothetical protein